MRVQTFGGRIVVGRVLLGEQQNLLLVIHHFFERAHGLLAADEERNDHVGKHDDIAQRQDRRQLAAVVALGGVAVVGFSWSDILILLPDRFARPGDIGSCP